MTWPFLLAGHQLLAWSIGLMLTMVLLDSCVGFLRDHPPSGWRRTALLVGPLAAIGAVCELIASPRWDLAALVVPFSLMATWYSLTWLRRGRAGIRRPLGWQAAILGVLCILFLMLMAGPAGWHDGVVMGVFAGTAALLGGFSAVLLMALSPSASDEVEAPATPYGIPARITAVGLGVTALAGGDTMAGAAGQAGVGTPIMLWLLLSLGLPLAFTAAGHALFPRFQRPIWAGALASVMVGQAFILGLMVIYPGLVPPNLL